MKTEAIRECLNVTATIGPVTHTRVNEARAELAAIREENARLREAVIDGIHNTRMLAQYYPGLYHEDAVAIEDLEAALSGEPSGKVLVDRGRDEIDYDAVRDAKRTFFHPDGLHRNPRRG